MSVDQNPLLQSFRGAALGAKERFTAFPVANKVVQRPSAGNLIDPEDSRYRVWEMLVVTVTIYVTLVTPFELAFISGDIEINGLFLINLCIDFIFLTDTALTFYIPYFDKQTGLYVYSQQKIAAHYLKGWFWLDVIPSIPYDLIAVLILLSTSSSSQLGALGALRVLRVLKILKIMRLAKLNNIYRKYQDKIPLRYTTISLIKFTAILLVCSHWLACIFRVLVEVGPSLNTVYDDRNWLDEYFDGIGINEIDYDILAEYIVAFYWAVMTLTTVGYGDVSPVSDFERAVVSIFMLIGAILYAYIVGSICGIIASMRRKDAQFFEKLDELDEFLSKEDLPHLLRLKVRNYIYYAESKKVYDQYTDLIDSLTPFLKEEVLTHRNDKFLREIPFILNGPVNELNRFIIDLSVLVKFEMYPPSEVLIRKSSIITKMQIIKSGTVSFVDTLPVNLNEQDEPIDSVKVGNIFYQNNLLEYKKDETGIYFGGAIICERDIISRYYVVALTYCELFQLNKNDLFHVLNQPAYQETATHIREYAERWYT